MRRSPCCGVAVAVVFACVYGAGTSLADAAAWVPRISREAALQAQTVSDMAGLHEWVRARQGHWLEITPPSEDFVFTQDETLLPFAWADFPADFRQGLQANPREREWGYSVVVREDPATHDLLFADADGRDFYRLTPPPDYDPLDALTPALLARRETLSDADRADFDRAYRVARIRLRVRLLPDAMIPAYLAAQRLAEAERNQALQAENADTTEPMLMRMLTPGGFGFELVSASSNTVTMSVQLPPDFGGSLDVYSIGDLMSFPWTLETNLTASAGALIETTLPTPDPIRFYHAADASVDGDQDSLPDAREIRLYGSNPEQADSDSDGLDDGQEIAAGTDPNHADVDADGLTDPWEVALGTDPYAAAADGEAELTVWTPMRTN